MRASGGGGAPGLRVPIQNDIETRDPDSDRARSGVEPFTRGCEVGYGREAAHHEEEEEDAEGDDHDVEVHEYRDEGRPPNEQRVQMGHPRLRLVGRRGFEKICLFERTNLKSHKYIILKDFHADPGGPKPLKKAPRMSPSLVKINQGNPV